MVQQPSPPDDLFPSSIISNISPISCLEYSLSTSCLKKQILIVVLVLFLLLFHLSNIRVSVMVNKVIIYQNIRE